MKKFLAIALAALLTLSLVACGNKNENTEQTGKDDVLEGAQILSDGNFTYDINEDGDLMVTGYLKAGEQKIPADYEGRPVTSIAGSAFKGGVNVTKVTIPDSIEKIGSLAFAYCENLTEIVIPNTVTELGEGVFYGCAKLAKVTLPSTLKEIPVYAFMGCSALTEIVFPETVESIGDGAFFDCVALTKVSVPANVKKIGKAAFIYCDALVEAVVLNAEAVIEEGAFAACNEELVLKGAANSTLKTYAEAEEITFAENK